MRLDGIMIWVPDVRRTVRFYEEAFDIRPRWVRDEGDYAQLETGEVVLQFAAESAAPTTGAEVRVARPADPPLGAQLALVADDVPAAVERAVGAGGALVADPVTKPWGQVIAYVRDVNGFLVELATAGD